LRELLKTRHELESLLRAREGFKEAEEGWRKALLIAEKQAKDFPAEPEYRRALAITLKALGGLLKAAGRAGEAEPPFRKALRLYEDLVGEVRPPPHDYWCELLEVRFDLQDVALEGGDFSVAEELGRKSLALADKLAADFPSTQRFRYLVAQSCLSLGAVLCETSRPQEAEQAFRRALAIASEPVTQVPEPGSPQSDYGLLLAECRSGLADLFLRGPGRPYGDPAEAVVLARKDAELRPEHGGCWTTLGTAYYRVGDWQAAAVALEKAVNLRNGGDCYDWFFLAMTRWRLGQREYARKQYDRAVAWMETHKGELEMHKTREARFRRFRAEAAELLGLSQAPERVDEAKVLRGPR
jgi:tetratricopeptide (TPR) repeat protein